MIYYDLLLALKGEVAEAVDELFGAAYANQGKLEEALESLQAARAIFLRMGANIQLQIVEENIERLNSKTDGAR